MPIAIFLVNQVYANRVAKSLLEECGDDIKLFIESDVLLQNRTLLEGLKRYLKIAGFYYVLTQTLKVEVYRIFSLVAPFFLKTDNKFYPYQKLAQKRKIPIIKAKDINSKEVLKILKKKKIDLIVSVFFNQILDKQVIHLPRSGVINIHPAYLPDYKGTGPIFWSLVNKEKFVGVTVHLIDEGIDTGGILFRKKVQVEDQDTEDSLYWKSTLAGIPLLLSAIDGLKNHKISAIKNKGGRFFRIPTKEAVSKFKKYGRLFYNLREYIFNH